MPYSRPTLETLLARVRADLKTYAAGLRPWLKDTFEYALAYVLAYMAHAQHGHVEWGVRQIFPQTADDEGFWAIASFWGITQEQPTPWGGTYRFTGVGLTNIPQGTIVVADTGATYQTVAEVFIFGGQADVTITATPLYYGTTYALDTGAPLTLQSPIAGVDADGEVLDTVQDPTDLETRESAYQRLLRRVRNPLAGGAAGDYVTWALQVAGITRAWEYPLADGVNTVAVAAVRDGDVSGIVLDVGEKATLLSYLQLVAPVTVVVSIRDLVEVPVDFQISVTPDTPGVRAAVELELRDVLLQYGEPGGIITKQQMDVAVSNAVGEESHHIESPPFDSVSFADNEIPVMGNLIWT